jgi:predicted lipid carrier protein YhbT
MIATARQLVPQRVQRGLLGATQDRRLAPLFRRIPYLPPEVTFAALPVVYRAHLGGRAEGILEVTIKGPGGGTWTLDIKPKGLRVQRGARQQPPDSRLTTDVFTWTAMATRRLDGTEAFMRGRLDVEGDIRLILTLEACFGGF